MHRDVPQADLALRRLYPTGGQATVEQVLDALQPPTETAGRPYVLLNMISTADGRATLNGRSGAIGDRADKQLFHGLRTTVDAVLAGAGTVRTERYHRVVRDERLRAIRRGRGLAEEPLMCIVSGRLDLLAHVPLLSEPGSRVVFITNSSDTLAIPDQGVEVEYVRCERHGTLDLAGALGALHERHGVRTLLCEGGPHLNTQLLAEGLVDELFLSLSPTLAGEDPVGGNLGILAGATLDPPVALELVTALEHESHLFLRYRVVRSRSSS